MDDAHRKLDRLKTLLRERSPALVCYSGGVDSAFLLHVAAHTLGDNAIAFTAVSPSLAQKELRQAQAFAQTLNVRHLVLDSYELENEQYAKNPTNRCYFCKTELLRLAKKTAHDLGTVSILLGTNADELSGHRPGLHAANEIGANHPLAEAGLTKLEIRSLSREFGLPTWDKPQMACLASRFPYGTRVTKERLHVVETFEDALDELGLRGVRVRFHEPIARIECDPNDMHRLLEHRAFIVEIGKKLGFSYVTLDLLGYRTGSLNEVLPDAERRVALHDVQRALGRQHPSNAVEP